MVFSILRLPATVRLNAARSLINNIFKVLAHPHLVRCLLDFGDNSLSAASVISLPIACACRRSRRERGSEPALFFCARSEKKRPETYLRSLQFLKMVEATRVELVS